MSTSTLNPKAQKVNFDSRMMWVELKDGRQIGVPLTFFPRLKKASLAQRKKYKISGGGLGLHWDALDEDISVAGLLAGKVDQTNRNLKRRRSQIRKAA
ncbi:DUF2442 domain-containing protein [bacterium]|nr:DUF2442 domain-containing protein [bacterium]